MTAPVPKSSADYQEEWATTPLFMQSLPEGDVEDNVALQALQSLMYEDGPEETANALRNQANEYYKGRKFREALSFYSQAINELGTNLSVDTRRTLHANRAACHLELQNYSSCLRDCALVLQLDVDLDERIVDQEKRVQTTRKALYRSARALLALDKVEEADDALQRLRAAGEPNAQLEAQLKDRRALLDASRSAKSQAATQRAEHDLRISQALRSRGLILPPGWSCAVAATQCPADVQPPHFDDQTPDLLCFAVFVLRPMASPPTRDLILEWLENVPVSMQLDATGLDASHEAYIVTAKGKLLKIGRKLCLRDIAKAASKPQDHDGMLLRDGWCLEIYAIPREHATEWTATMKQTLQG